MAAAEATVVPATILTSVAVMRTAVTTVMAMATVTGTVKTIIK